ncbi:hypothetical protein MAR_033374 [Mya arenaria]|uniref:Uncharacterized protein n=1 Tax=Mya arenaria TaxID=6604 RepID=A0ABY7G8T6_MYAAR|nr:hypothetical protein MAR_033374 [Mya arenaria]
MMYDFQTIAQYTCLSCALASLCILCQVSYTVSEYSPYETYSSSDIRNLFSPQSGYDDVNKYDVNKEDEYLPVDKSVTFNNDFPQVTFPEARVSRKAIKLSRFIGKSANKSCDLMHSLNLDSHGENPSGMVSETIRQLVLLLWRKTQK